MKILSIYHGHRNSNLLSRLICMINSVSSLHLCILLVGQMIRAFGFSLNAGFLMMLLKGSSFNFISIFKITDVDQTT